MESHDYVLLEGLERTDLALPGDSPQRQTFSVEQCTRRNSPFLDNYRQEEFRELRVDMDGFEDWLDLDSILVSAERRQKDHVQVNVSYKEYEFVSPVLDGTMSINSMTMGADLLGYFATHPQRDVHFRQKYDLTFRPGRLSDLATLRYVYTTIEEFIALLTGFYHRLNWPILVRDEQPFETWNTFYFYRGSSSGRSINGYFFWVPFARIRDGFGKLFEKWQLKREALGAGHYLFISLMRNPHIYSEDRFMNLVWGLEAFHRKSLGQLKNTDRVARERERVERIVNSLPQDSEDQRWLRKKLKYAHEPSLEARILECFRELPFNFGKGQLEKFAKECASRRNDISHEGGPRGDMDYASFMKGTSSLAEALDYLFHALLLQQIGIASDILFETMNKSWLAERQIKPALAEVGLQIQTSK